MAFYRGKISLLNCVSLSVCRASAYAPLLLLFLVLGVMNSRARTRFEAQVKGRDLEKVIICSFRGARVHRARDPRQPTPG